MVKNTFATLGILALLLLSVGIASAASGTTTLNGITMTVNETSLTNVTTGETYSFEVTIENQNGTDYNVSFGTSGWTWDKSGVTIADTTTETFKGTLTIGTTSTKSVIAKFYNILNSSEELFDISKTISLSYYTDPSSTPSDYNFCEVAGKVGDLEISDVAFNNLGEGEDDDWYLLDEIEIEVEIENTHSSDNVKDVIVEIMILDSDDNDVTKDFDFDDEEINLNTIKDDDSEIATFRIKEVPADLDSGSYKLYIKAYSEDAEDEQCVAEAASKYLSKELYQRIDVTREDDPAVIVKFDELKISTSCGAKGVELPLSVYNLGSDKEESVLVVLENYQLGISEKLVIDNLKSGKRKDVSFFFDVPEELSSSTYTLSVVTYYDYDDDEDELELTSYSENSEDDLDETFETRLEINSCVGAKPSIDASLESGAEIGQDLIIKAIITNNGNDNDFSISASNFEAWADLVSVTPQTASINKGEFAEVTIVLRPKTAGTQSFKINTIVDGESYAQSVSVNIAGESGGLFGSNNLLTYTVIGIIAVLVLIFLVLIIKVSRRPVKPQF